MMVAGMVAMVVAVVLVMGLAGVAVAPIHEGVKHHGQNAEVQFVGNGHYVSPPHDEVSHEVDPQHCHEQ